MVDYAVQDCPLYRDRVLRHFVSRCHERGIVDMTIEFARKLNDLAIEMNRYRTGEVTSKHLVLYRTPAWSTKIYQIVYGGTPYYLIFDVRKKGFVTVITQEQMDARDKDTCSLHRKTEDAA